MNLDGMLKEGSLTDLSWYEEGMKNPGEVTFDPSESEEPNDVKQEAQDQWGYNDMSPIFDEDEPSGIMGEQPADTKVQTKVVAFVRHMMNQGATTSEVDREVRKKFAREDLSREVEGLKEMFSLNGIVGRVAVDARGYESCKAAMETVRNSPYKGTIRFVMGCSCGDPHMIPADDKGFDIVSSSGNPADDFLSSGEDYSVKEVPHCRSTMLPLYASMDELDPSWVNDLMVVVENVSGLPGEESKRIKMLDKKPIEKVKEAFRAIDAMSRKEDLGRYVEKVDASEFMIDPAENEIELFAEAQPELEVDASAGDFLGEEVPEVLASNEDVDMMADLKGTLFEGSDVIELEEIKAPESDLEMNLDDSELTW